MKKALPILAALIFCMVATTAQVALAPTVVASGGGYAETDNISISWTLGELAVSTLTGGNMILTQGFQQPYRLWGVDIKNIEATWGIFVYPNPVKDELRIRFNTEKPGDYLVEIQDVTGRLMIQEQHKQVNPGDIVIVNTSTFFVGVYFLKVLTPDRQQIQVTRLRKL